MLRTYSSSGLKYIQSAGREIFPTTKDKLDAALNAPPTAAVLEKEVHNRIVEDNYLLSEAGMSRRTMTNPMTSW